MKDAVSDVDHILKKSMGSGRLRVSKQQEKISLLNRFQVGLLDIQMDKNCMGKMCIENIQESQEEIHVAGK